MHSGIELHMSDCATDRLLIYTHNAAHAKFYVTTRMSVHMIQVFSTRPVKLDQ